MDFEKMPSGSPHLRDRENEADTHVILPRAPCASQRQSQTNEPGSLKQFPFSWSITAFWWGLHLHLPGFMYVPWPTASKVFLLLQCSSEQGNFLPGDVWLDTTSLPGWGCCDSCSWFGKSSSCQSSANTTLAYLVFSRKSKYAPVFSLLIFSCLCLLLFGISDVKADLCCQYFNSRFQKKYPHLSQWWIWSTVLLRLLRREAGEYTFMACFWNKNSFT